MPLVGRAPGFQPRCLRNPCSSRLNAHSQTKLSRIRLFSSKMPHPYFCVKHFPARQSVTVHIKTQKNISKKSPSMVSKKKTVNIGGWPDWFERAMAQLSTMVMGCHRWCHHNEENNGTKHLLWLKTTNRYIARARGELLPTVASSGLNACGPFY